MNTKNKVNPSEDYQTIIRNRYMAIHPVSDYAKSFEQNCTQDPVRISTGYESLDIALNGGVTNELYIIAAETSTGKSALTMSMAQHIAACGTYVLYFALEMSQDEFIARGISSLSYQAFCSGQSTCCYTSADILYHSYDPATQQFSKVPFNEYKPFYDQYFQLYGEHLYIIESGMDGWIARDIANAVVLWKRDHPDTPVVVFIDYLQNIKADPSDRSQQDRKTKTDVCVNTLKTLSSQVGVPVITISSVSRSNYHGRIGTSCFKESGDTEYTAGILLGWNWLGITDSSYEDDIIKEKRQCAERGYRRMELDILKYRNAQRDQSVYLYYYPAYNYFVEANKDFSDVFVPQQSVHKF